MQTAIGFLRTLAADPPFPPESCWIIFVTAMRSPWRMRNSRPSAWYWVMWLELCTAWYPPGGGADEPEKPRYPPPDEDEEADLGVSASEASFDHRLMISLAIGCRWYADTSDADEMDVDRSTIADLKYRSTDWIAWA